MSKKTVHATAEAPGALGPYSQATSAPAGSRPLFVSGQLGLKPGATSLEEGVEAQTAQAMANMGAILNTAGSSFSNVLKTTVLLADLADFDAVNKVYATFFAHDPPARACFQVARLPKDARVEIEAVAFI